MSAIHVADGCQSAPRPPQVRPVAVPTGPPGNCDVKTHLGPAIDRTVDCVARASVIQRAVSGQAPKPVSIFGSKP